MKNTNQKLMMEMTKPLAMAQPLTACPFSDPKYYLDNDAPCPVCGALGDDDSAENKCIDNNR